MTLFTYGAAYVASQIAYDSISTGSFTQSIQAKLEQTISVKDAGAAGDGVTDDRNFIALADAQGSFIFTAGTYKIASDLTITNPVIFLPDAMIIVPDGVTVAFSSSVSAGVYQIFSCVGTGKITLNHRFTASGYPEWWGAIADMSIDCLAAFHAARDALLIIECQGGDYLISDTLKWNKQHRTLAGVNCQYNDTSAEVTRIVIASSSATICQYGPDTQPENVNSFYQGINIKNIYFGRNIAPLISSNCVGVLSRWTLYGCISNCKTDGNMIGFKENGTVHLTKERCEAVRAQAGTGAGTDYFIGHYADGSGSIGLAGGNASLYYHQCSAGCNYGPLQTASGSIGFKADGKFTDLFYRDPESTNFYYSQVVFGNDNTGLVYSNTDCIIEHPVHDQFHHAGIYITDIAASGSIEIENPYFGPSTDARVCVWLNSNSGGSVVCRGGQFVMGVAPLAQAILIAGSNNSHILNFPTIIEHGSNYPMLSCDSSGCILTINSLNPTVAAGACVQLNGSPSACIVEPRCSGAAGKVQYGIQVVGTADTNNEYRVTGIESSCLPSASRKLFRNDVGITSIGLTGSNYATGVFT